MCGWVHENRMILTVQTFPALLKIFPTVLKLDNSKTIPGWERERGVCMNVSEKTRWRQWRRQQKRKTHQQTGSETEMQTRWPINTQKELKWRETDE